MRLNLNEWLTYIESLHVSAIDLGLSRILPLATALGLTRFDVPVITVSGTNGKGSVVKCVESIYRFAGYNTAAYTSPHLIRFNERLRINESDISDQKLISAFEKVESLRCVYNTTLSFFEFTTLACLEIIKDENADVIILEIGLGGRLDAVNIVDNDCAVVTNIDLDHIEWLGDTREKIAYEKASIFRANKLAVCGDPNPPSVIAEIAKERNVDIQFINRDYDIPDWFLPLEMTSQFHANNVATAVQVIKKLQPVLPVTNDQIKSGFSLAKLTGRHERLNNIWFDVSHNLQSVSYLFDRLDSEPISGRQIAIFSMLKDKNWQAVIEVMEPIIDKWYVAECYGWRALKLADMIAGLRAIGVSVVESCLSMKLAAELALSELKSNDRLVVFGSFQTVAGVKGYVDDKAAEK